MTIIVAFKDPQTQAIHYGSDTRVTENDGDICPPSEKFVHVGKRWAVGLSGSMRNLTIMKYGHGKMGDTDAMSIWEFSEAVREMISKCGVSNTDHTVPSYSISMLMIDFFNRQIFEVATDFSIGQVHDEMAARGSGYGFALGCWFGIKDIIGITGQEIVERCVGAAIKYEAQCGGEIVVYESRPI